MAPWRRGCVLLTLLVLHATASAADVVVHHAHPEAAIDRSLLRGVFGMRVRAWPDGRPAHVFVLPDQDAVHQEFCRFVLQMYPYQLRANWDRLVYSGTGQQPVTVESEQELLRRVAETPGGIGYVRQYLRPKPVRTRTAPEPLNSVKVLHVR